MERSESGSEFWHRSGLQLPREDEGSGHRDNIFWTDILYIFIYIFIVLCDCEGSKAMSVFMYKIADIGWQNPWEEKEVNLMIERIKNVITKNGKR